MSRIDLVSKNLLANYFRLHPTSRGTVVLAFILRMRSFPTNEILIVLVEKSAIK